MNIEKQYRDKAVVYAENEKAWAQWLAENGGTVEGVWLVIFKKGSQVSSVIYPEAVDTALCYGWIDSLPNKRDAQSYYQYFAPRNPKSNWSKVNKEKIKRLEKEGRLAPPGIAMIKLAKESGTWDALNDVDNLVVPIDLEEAMQQYSSARKNWDAFPPSTRRGILEWIFNAKRPATRAKRIAETAALAQKNERANQFKRK